MTDVSGVGRAHLQYQELCLRPGGEDRKRQADLVVEVALGRTDFLAGRTKYGCERVLGGRLSDGPGNSHDGGSWSILPRERPPRQFLQGRQRLLDHQRWDLELAIRNHSHCTAPVGLRSELRAVHFSSECEEKLAVTHFP